jgi:hypothetical protein
MGNRIYLRSLFATVALATVTPSANANSLVMTVEGCKVVSTSDKPFSTSWNGNCKDGLANGPGTVIWSLDGKEFSRVSGNYVDGQVVDGPSQVTRADGLRVEALYLNGKAVRAVIHYPSGGTYDGEILDFKPNGQGIMRFPSGNEYTGSWQAGKKSGHGVLHFPNGAKYEGEFSGDLFNGHGVLMYADGGVYNGNWIGGKRNGHGTMRNPDGSVYEGEFSNGDATGTTSAPPGRPATPLANRDAAVAVGASGLCHTDLSFLRARFPQFSDPTLRKVEDTIFSIKITDAIAEAKSQGRSSDQAVQAEMAQADEDLKSARDASNFVVAITLTSDTGDDLFRALKSGKIDPNMVCEGASAASECAAMAGVMGAVANRAVAAEMQCRVRNGMW